MSSQAYIGLSQRTFQQALIHRLETDYGLLGSRRVLDLLAQGELPQRGFVTQEQISLEQFRSNRFGRYYAEGEVRRAA